MASSKENVLTSLTILNFFISTFYSSIHVFKSEGICVRSLLLIQLEFNYFSIFVRDIVVLIKKEDNG